MLFQSWISSLFQPRRRTIRKAIRRTTRLGVELLEDRLTPSTLGTHALLEGPAISSASVAVTTTGAWTATANDAWLHVTTPAGTDNGTGVFTLDANTGPTRVGTLSIAGETLTVTQAGSTYEAAHKLFLVGSGGTGGNDVAVDGAGNVYSADYYSNAIKKWDASTQTVSTLASGVDRPRGVAVDGAGNVFFIDGNSTIMQWNATTQQVSTVIAASGNQRTGLAVDGAGNLYIAGHNNYAAPARVEKWDAATHTLSTVFSLPSPRIVGGNGGIAVTGGVALDAAGNLYLASFDTIFKWNAATQSVSSFIEGLNWNYGVAVDGSGDVYFDNAEPSAINPVIQKWHAATQTISTVVTRNSGGLAFNSPDGMAVDSAGNVYISDTNGTGITRFPHAFVPTAPFNEFAPAGSDSLGLPVLSTTQPLTGIFAPTSDQSWLTIDSVPGDVVHFSFTQNTTGASRTATISILGTTTSVTQSAVIPNAPPAIAVNAPASVTVNEGSLATKTGTWSDANAGDTVTLSASIGTVVKSGTNAAGTWSWSYTPPEEAAAQTVTITANDGTASTQTTFSLTVTAAPLTAGTVSASGGVEGVTPTTLTATFTDANANAPTSDFSGTISWGDTSTNFTSANVTANGGGNFTVTPSHQYAEEGSHPISVTINDVGGSTITEATYVPSPTHLWKGEGNTSDSVAGGPAGTINGAVTFTTGQVGSAFNFPGSGGRPSTTPSVSYPASVFAPGTADFSIAFDMKTTITTGNIPVLGNRSNGSGGNFMQFRWNSNNPDTKLEAALYQDAVGTNSVVLISTTVVNDGNWHNIVVTRSGTSANLYIDGVLNASGNTAAPTNLNNGNAFKLGAEQGEAATFTPAFTGQLDEVQIYNQALSLSQVQAQNAARTAVGTVADAPLTAGTVSASGGVAGLTPTSLTAAFTDANTGAPTSDFSGTIFWGDTSTNFTSSSVTGSGGSYSVSGSHQYATAGNFNITVTINDVGGSSTSDSGSTTVASAASFTTTIGAGPFTYDGSTHAGGSGTVTGINLNTTTTSMTYSANADGTGVADRVNAGTYYVTAHYAGDTNHLPSDGAAVAITIGQKAASVTADHKTKTYGDANPALTATVVGTVNGDVLNYTLATTAGQYSNVGDVAITVSLGTNSNYNVTATNDTLTINKKAATVTADHKTKTYGDANPALTAAVTGTVNGDALSYSLATTAGQFSNVGNYGIAVTLGTNGNYSVTSADSTLTVNQAMLVATGRSVTPIAGAPFVNGVVASFAAAGPTDTAASYTATITWGDGSSSAGTIALNTATGLLQVTGSHTYADPRSDTTSVLITNVLGNTSPATVGGTATVTSLGVDLADNQARQIGFWHSNPGQTLIASLNGGATATALGNWLATTFPNLYGATAGSHNMTGQTNSQVVAFFESLYAIHRDNPDVEVLATALNIYVTTTSLGGTAGQAYNFRVTAEGLGAVLFNVGEVGATVGAANGTTMNAFQMLQAANQRAVSGVLYAATLSLRDPAEGLFEKLTRTQYAQTEEIGFWHRDGQALINSFNGGSTATALGNWLAVTFPNLYGATAGSHNLTGKTNAQVAAFFQTLWGQGNDNADVQVLATALNVYATTLSLGGTVGQAYGFLVTNEGLGAVSFTVNQGGAAVGVANGTTLNVYEMLKAVNQRAVNGVLAAGNAGQQDQLEDLFERLNRAGDGA